MESSAVVTKNKKKARRDSIIWLYVSFYMTLHILERNGPCLWERKLGVGENQGWVKVKVKVAQSCLTLYSPWNSPGQNTGVGSLSLLWEIFSTQVSHIAGRFFASWATKQGGEEDLISVLRSLRLFDFFTLHKFCLLKKIKRKEESKGWEEGTEYLVGICSWKASSEPFQSETHTQAPEGSCWPARGAHRQRARSVTVPSTPSITSSTAWGKTVLSWGRAHTLVETPWCTNVEFPAALSTQCGSLENELQGRNKKCRRDRG